MGPSRAGCVDWIIRRVLVAPPVNKWRLSGGTVSVQGRNLGRKVNRKGRRGGQLDRKRRRPPSEGQTNGSPPDSHPISPWARLCSKPLGLPAPPMVAPQSYVCFPNLPMEFHRRNPTSPIRDSNPLHPHPALPLVSERSTWRARRFDFEISLSRPSRRYPKSPGRADEARRSDAQP